MSEKYLDPAEDYFATDEMVETYSNPKSSAVKNMQRMAQQAWDLLKLADNSFRPFILDVGCGAGAGSYALNELGAIIVGADITPEMLLKFKENVDNPINQIICADAGLGLPFRPGFFDAAIGIDVLNWILHPVAGGLSVSKRLKAFLESVHGCLALGGKACFNFNPESPDIAQLVSTTATLCGFGGSIYVENPNSGASRVNWLILEVGGAAVTVEENSVQIGCPTVGTTFHQGARKQKTFDKKEWIMKKKERQKMLGKTVARDSKYTGRSRRRWI